jgi:PPIC-type PPIASE domain
VRIQRVPVFRVPVVGVTVVRVAALLFSGSLLLGACAGSSSNEAVISGKLAPTTEKELEADLKMVTAIPSFVTGWKAGTQKDATSGKKGKYKYSDELVAFMLQNRYFNALIQEEGKARKLKPAAVTDEMKGALSQATPGEQETLDAYPAKYRENLLLTQQYIESMIKTAGGDPRKYYDTHPEEFIGGCLSHILVKTEDEAKAAVKRIEGGEAFEKVAKELSQDPGSGAQGGDLGCADLQSYVPEFAAAAEQLKEGVLSPPVKTQFGFHILKKGTKAAKPWGPEVEAQATQSAQQAGVEQIRTALAKRAKGAGTKINPKYGVLSDEGGLPQIGPRVVPGATTTAPGLGG